MNIQTQLLEYFTDFNNVHDFTSKSVNDKYLN